ncbi:MAG: hypothetical protein BWY36_00986 [Candidatus Diapherotrites archaeon ADurb.Bin253]|nr:MAG: hypothetical protein BWY36_00986 [Candidatus Diapherotrites archaeon ADurb.Bin253]
MDLSKKTDKYLAKELARVSTEMDALKEQSEALSEELQKRKPSEVFFFPELEKKVYLAEGRESSSYDVMQVFTEMMNNGLTVEFPKIVKINQEQVQKNVEDIDHRNMIESILKKNAKISIGEAKISVRKMTKQELKENTK